MNRKALHYFSIVALLVTLAGLIGLALTADADHPDQPVWSLSVAIIIAYCLGSSVSRGPE